MTETNKKQFRVRRWMKIWGGVVVALALVLVLLPFGVKYHPADSLIKSGADAVSIEKLRYNPFAGSFTFKGQLNDGPIALDVLPTLAGAVALDGKLLFSQGAETGIETDYDGTIGLTGPDLGNSGFTTKAESLSWMYRGTIHYAAAEKSPQQIVTDGLLAARGLHLRNQ